MSDADDSGPTGLGAVADRLYGLHPDEFVAARDDAVAQARAAGERDLARAIGRLRRPTRAAWLANLLAHRRAEQLDGLLALAGDLATAQRTLDGPTLRALSAQRHRLVTAMAREAGRLAAQSGDSATEPVLRDVAGILDAALADPGVAAELRAGRLTRTVGYSGFGPAADTGTPGRPAPPPRPVPSPEPGRAEPDRAAQERAERERAEREHAARERERAARQQELDEAERADTAARGRAEADATARAAAESAHEQARAAVAEREAELAAARDRERDAAAGSRAAAARVAESARDAAAAGARVARARARLAELGT